MADGVPADRVYEVLGSDAGVDRAFAKLDAIKGDVLWWESGAQPPQMLADGEVVMTVAYNGRLFNAIATENKPFEIVWDGQVWDLDLWVIPKGAPNMKATLDFLAFFHRHPAAGEPGLLDFLWPGTQVVKPDGRFLQGNRMKILSTNQRCSESLSEPIDS